MDNLTPVSFTISSPNLTEHSLKLYESLGLSATLLHSQLTISSTSRTVIKNIEGGVHVHIHDHTILPKLASAGLLTEPIHFVDEAGINVTAEFVGPQNFKIAVLTSGGDAPGMNGAIRSIVRKAYVNGSVVYGVRNGFEGLITDSIQEIGWDDVSAHFSHGGTFLLSARSKQFRNKEGRREAVYNLIRKGISGLVVLGGDGSMEGALTLSNEFMEHAEELYKSKRIEDISKIEQLKVVVIPASIDNDIVGAEMTLGADSALMRVTECVDSLWTTMASHRRAFVIEVMGRCCGWIALMGGLSCGADYVFLPEMPHQNWEVELKTSIARARKEGKLGSIVIVSEGCEIDLNKIKEKIEELEIETRVISLGHIQRGGRPTAFDRIMGTLLGCKAIECLSSIDKKPVMVVLSEGEYKVLCLKKSVKENNNVGDLIKKKAFQEIMEKRGKLFGRAYGLSEQLRKGCVEDRNVDGFEIVAKERRKPTKCAKEKTNGRLAVMHIGTRAGGMNVALHTIVRYASTLGHKVLVITDGFEGLLNDQILEAEPYDYADGQYNGMSIIGSSEDKHIDVEKVYKKLKEYNIGGLIIAGGRDALNIIIKMNTYFDNLLDNGTTDSENQNKIPTIILIPASVDNDLPFTDISLGADTALNIITMGCDFLRLSSLTRKKTVFVVEVPGDHSGYLAMVGGVASGAFDCFIPETKQSLHTLALTSQRLKERLKEKNRHGLILIKNQKTYDGISLDAFSKIINADSEGIFDIKYSVFGYFVEGGAPSPYDRICATSLATKAVDTCLKKQLIGVIGINGDKIVVSSIENALKKVKIYENGEMVPKWVKLLDVVRSLE